MIRSEFVKMVRELVDELEEDHEEHTGITETESLDFSAWLNEIESLYTNTRK